MSGVSEIDKSAAQDILSELSERQRTSELTWEEIERPVDPHAAEMLSAVERCAKCLVCQTSCPVVQTMPDDYVGPAGMVAIALRYYDPYDERDRIVQAVDSGVWNCIMCGTCDVVCPALEIEHVNMWTEIRAAATERNLTGKVGSALKHGTLE